MTTLIWIDLETTGTTESMDEIIEVAAIVTGVDLEPRESYCATVQPSRAALERLRANPYVYAMHRRNGLLSEIEQGGSFSPEFERTQLTQIKSIEQVERDLLAMMRRLDSDMDYALCGSGVSHFDRRFIRFWMPGIDKTLRHWHLDIGTIRRFLQSSEDTKSLVPTFNKKKNHRAMDDIKLHLEEARHYRRLATTMAVAGRMVRGDA